MFYETTQDVVKQIAEEVEWHKKITGQVPKKVNLGAEPFRIAMDSMNASYIDKYGFIHNSNGIAGCRMVLRFCGLEVIVSNDPWEVSVE